LDVLFVQKDNIARLGQKLVLIALEEKIVLTQVSKLTALLEHLVHRVFLTALLVVLVITVLQGQIFVLYVRLARIVLIQLQPQFLMTVQSVPTVIPETIPV
jgi:hypothetical protein